MPLVPLHTQITPSRIHRNNHLNLLNPKQSLDLLLSIDRLEDVIEALVVNQPVDLVTLAKLRAVPLLVLPHTTMEVASHSNVKPLRAVCQNVNAVTAAIVRMHSY